MSELPYTTGLTDEFTTLVPTSVSASEWVNQKGSANFILQNADFADDTITIAGSNVAWLPITEPTEYTAYILCKTYFTPNSSYPRGRWAQFFGCRNGDNRCYVGVSMYSSTINKLRLYNTVPSTSITMDDWHVITVKRTGGYYYVYADGELIISEANTATTRGDKFMIKSISDVGSTPTVDEAITVYLKYCAVFNIVQTDDQIKENCNQILVDFGLKEAEKDSRLAGADAAAITYAIAKNNETMSALEDIIKSYREGVKEGDDGDSEVTEVIDEDGNVPVEPPMDEDDPDDVDLRGADVYYTVETPDGTLYYLRIYTLKETGIGSSERGSYEYAWTYLLVYDLYDENGSAIKTEMPINTYYSAYVVPSNVWYFKPSHVAADYVNTGYNIYMYVEKVRFTGESIVVHWVTVHAVNDEVNRGTAVTTVKGIPDGATIIHTSTSRPF